MEIILLRHGKPDDLSTNKISASSFREWITLYNATGLCDTSTPTNDVKNVAAKCKAVVCSELPRSIESSKALNIHAATLTDSIFNEAGMPSANWRYLKLSPKLWAVIFRVLWLFGYSKNSESYKQAKTRVSESTKILANLAKKHKSVLFVGHGIYNRLIAKELKACGWEGPKNPGTSYWSYSTYTNRTLGKGILSKCPSSKYHKLQPDVKYR